MEEARKDAIAESAPPCFYRGMKVRRPWRHSETGTVVGWNPRVGNIEVRLDRRMGFIIGPVRDGDSPNWEPVPLKRLEQFEDVSALSSPPA